MDLAALLAEHAGRVPLVRRLVRAARGRYRRLERDWTPENALVWLAERRPDLYRAVAADEGLLLWFAENMRRLRAYLWGDGGKGMANTCGEEAPGRGGDS